MFKKIKAQLKDASDRAVVTFFVMIFWTILKLRYRIVVINADAIRKIQKGALFLSNHTSLLDAVMVGSVLWRNCRPRPFPVAVEEHYYSPLEYWYLSRVRTVPIPDFSSGTFDWKEEKLEKTINQILNGLKEKKSVMLFPSGTMKHTARENLDGSSIIHRLLQRSESTNICLVRITGLWGSSFSREGTSKCPTLESGWGKRIFQILVNGFFFMPKRKIVIEFEPIPLKALGHSVPEINSQLEKWYNAPSPDGEPAIHPPHYFWQKESPSQIPKKEESEEQSLSEKEILLEKEVIEDIAKILSIPCETLTRDTKLGLDLGLDSLDIAQLALYFETKYDLGIVSFNELHLKVLLLDYFLLFQYLFLISF